MVGATFDERGVDGTADKGTRVDGLHNAWTASKIYTTNNKSVTLTTKVNMRKNCGKYEL
jgi:hypothetical protein